MVVIAILSGHTRNIISNRILQSGTTIRVLTPTTHPHVGPCALAKWKSGHSVGASSSIELQAGTPVVSGLSSRSRSVLLPGRGFGVSSRI